MAFEQTTWLLPYAIVGGVPAYNVVLTRCVYGLSMHELHWGKPTQRQIAVEWHSQTFSLSLTTAGHDIPKQGAIDGMTVARQRFIGAYADAVFNHGRQGRTASFACGRIVFDDKAEPSFGERHYDNSMVLRPSCVPEDHVGYPDFVDGLHNSSFRVVKPRPRYQSSGPGHRPSAALARATLAHGRSKQ